jgi:signal transduction histidine kinase
VSERPGGARAGTGTGAAIRFRGLRVGQSLSITIGVLLLFAIAGIGVALVANHRLSDKRFQLLEEIAPSSRAALRLEDALVNQETGLRGYLLSKQASFLGPYRSGRKAEAEALATLGQRLPATGTVVGGYLAEVRARIGGWQAHYVQPVLRAATAGPGGRVSSSELGKGLFDAIRRPLQRMQAELASEDSRTRSQLTSAADFQDAVLIVAAVMIVGSLLGAALFLRRMIISPLSALDREAQRVGDGDFNEPIDIGEAPREIAQTAVEMNAMRERIVHELALVTEAHTQLGEQALELQRSNEELEQFAYVASHDLQEPLRKVASFCQALQLRYADQLDERANQYIEFAVDGARRMQDLINALLALSRVGRTTTPVEPVEMEAVLATVERSLSERLAETGATLTHDRLPLVMGQRSLLVSLLENLVGNALKFHGAAPPAVHIGAEQRDDQVELSVADNGIGVEAAYAERVFQIFQRLHTREAYEGTGIGLALCRKIVEQHGGRIWLDLAYSPGACFRLTLPMTTNATTSTEKEQPQ